jgi:hypothetical protein
MGGLVFLLEPPEELDKSKLQDHWGRFEFGEYRDYVSDELKEVMPYNPAKA